MRVLSLLFAAGAALPSEAQGAGLEWRMPGIAIRDTAENPFNPVITSASGGVYVVWGEDRSGSSGVFAQRFTMWGTHRVGWADGGTTVCDTVREQIFHVAATSSTGGLFVAWTDFRWWYPQLYVQTVDGDGRISAGWPANGVQVYASTPYSTAIAASDDGGVFVSWYENPTKPGNVRLQKLSSNGSRAPGWPPEGAIISNNPLLILGGETYLLSSDGSDGAFAAWIEASDGRLRCRRLSGSGSSAPGWPDTGVVLGVDTGAVRVTDLKPWGDGGALVVWEDSRSDTGDVCLTRLGGDGLPVAGWSLEGTLIGLPGLQSGGRAVISGGGDVVVTWVDERNGNKDIFASRLGDGNLDPAWPADGAALCLDPRAQYLPEIASDGSGGAIVQWWDERYDTTGSIAPNAFAVQRVTALGAIASGWPLEGLIVRTVGRRIRPAAPVADGESGVFVAWSEHERDGSTSDAFVQRISAEGVIAPEAPPSAISFSMPRPNPGSEISMEIYCRDRVSSELCIMDISGRLVARPLERTMLDPGRHVLRWAGEGMKGTRVRPGIYLARLRSDGIDEVRRFVLLK